MSYGIDYRGYAIHRAPFGKKNRSSFIASLHRFLGLAARVSAGLAMATTPYILEIDDAGGFKVELAVAHAKNGNNGNGNGNSSSNSGSGKGNNGKGNGGNSGSDANNGKGKGSQGGSAAKSNSGRGAGRATGDKVTVQGNIIEVVHPDGISERIEAGRFKMKDALGRTIIDRAAKAADIERLKGF